MQLRHSRRRPESYPEFFPGSVKHLIQPEQHAYHCALACVEVSLKMVPRAKPAFDSIVLQLDSPGCQKMLEFGDMHKKLLTPIWLKYVEQTFAGKRSAYALMVIKVLPHVGKFAFYPDFWKLMWMIRRFIFRVFNDNPKERRVTGTPALFLAVITHAQFYRLGMGPYEHDKLHRPLSADAVLVRPKTVEGRKAKTKYNNFMQKYDKHTDRYYLKGAERWLLARVIIGSVAETERRLNLSQGQLNEDFYREPWDYVMGYKKN